MTNRMLIQKAFSLTSLSEEEWNEVSELKIKLTGCLLTAVETLISNQAKIEVLSNYLDYYGDSLDEKVPQDKMSVNQI